MDSHGSADATGIWRRDIPGMPAPGRSFVRALQAPLDGHVVYVSGITAQGDAGAIADPGDMRAQARTVFSHLARLLDVLGAGFAHVAKLTLYTTDMDRWHDVDLERREWFREAWPAATAVEVNRFVNPDALLEVEAVVHLPDHLAERALEPWGGSPV